MKDVGEVFCRLRVASKDNGVKHSTTIVYNGISANDWLSPIGISRGKSTQVDKSGGVVVETLTGRPFTANSVVIIRPNHRKYHGLGKDVSLIGQRLQSAPEITSINYDAYKISEAYANRRGFNPKIISQPLPPRPATVCSGSNYSAKARNKKSRIIKSCANYSSATIKFDDSLDLTVQSLEKCQRSLKDKDATVLRFSEKTHCNNSESKMHFKGDNMDTIDGLKRSYMKRAQSAPPGAFRSKASNESTDGKKPALYWRAKSAYHRRQVTKETEQSEIWKDSSEPKGSLLRPLMYTSDGDIKHSAGCPYKCKGCFKACLVSDDYLDKAQQRQGRPQSCWRDQRRIRRSPGFNVQLALAKSQPLYKMVHGHHQEETGSHEGGSVDLKPDHGTETVEEPSNESTGIEENTNQRIAKTDASAEE